MSEVEQRNVIRGRYRYWRSVVDMTQAEVEAAVRELFPEFPPRAYLKIENADAFPTPTARKALAVVLKVKESELPASLSDAKAARVA